jgi:hypothetical protein
MLNLKVTFANGASLKLLGLADGLTLDGLRAALLEKTGIPPEDQHGASPRSSAPTFSGSSQG